MTSWKPAKSFEGYFATIVNHGAAIVECMNGAFIGVKLQLVNENCSLVWLNILNESELFFCPAKAFIY